MAAEQRHYDLVVIGSGPAGEKGAAQAAYFGKKVAVIEREPVLGGACTNTGTLPSKTLRETALYLSGLRQRDIYGLAQAVHTGKLGVHDFMVQKEFVVDRERQRIARNLERHSIDLLRGDASLVDAHTVKIVSAGAGTYTVSAEVILIATGSRPRRPDNIPFDDVFIDDSDEVLQLPQIPKQLIVVGGGVIGSEYASVFAALGITKVTLVESRDRILNFLDREIGDGLAAALGRLGVELICDQQVMTYERRADGTGVKATLENGRVLEADRLLAAAGRSGNTEELNLPAVGIKLDDRKRIVVDDVYRTSVPSVFAAGDVIGFPSLASTSMEQARVAVCAAFGMGSKSHIAQVFPYGLYTIPEAAMIGDTEDSARQRGIDVEVGKASYRENARGQIINDQDGFMKLVFDASNRKLLGVHCLGERATELVHIAQAVQHFAGTIHHYIAMLCNYPSLSDVYKYAAYDGLGRLAKRGKTVDPARRASEP
jgi:NAD(P) transhydrogenase